MIFLTILGVMETLCIVWLVLEMKTGKEIPKSSTLEFLEKFLPNNFALSDAEDNTSGLLYWGFDGKSMETEKKIWSEFPYEGKAIAEQILASEETNRSKRTGLWESV